MTRAIFFKHAINHKHFSNVTLNIIFKKQCKRNGDSSSALLSTVQLQQIDMIQYVSGH